MDAETPEEQHDEGFDLGTARLPDFYPAEAVLAEIGRVTMAAARVDRQLALILFTVKYREPECPEPFDVLLKWSSSKLYKVARQELERRFEGELLEYALEAVDAADGHLERRHSVAHSIWEPHPLDTSFRVGTLSSLRSQDELDELVRERGSTARYQVLHPKADGPGPQETAELEQIRRDLEVSKYRLDRLRYVLASALFAGSPAGATKVPELKITHLREPGDS